MMKVFLILYYYNQQLVVIPEPYKSYSSCLEEKTRLETAGWNVECVIVD